MKLDLKDKGSASNEIMHRLFERQSNQFENYIRRGKKKEEQLAFLFVQIRLKTTDRKLINHFTEENDLTVVCATTPFQKREKKRKKERKKSG